MTDPGEFAAVDNEFVRCRCGKERPVRIDPRLGEHVMRRLAEMSACRACEADFAREVDSCPETLNIPNGVSACSLTWHHEGRCQPYPAIDLSVATASLVLNEHEAKHSARSDAPPVSD